MCIVDFFEEEKKVSGHLHDGGCFPGTLRYFHYSSSTIVRKLGY